MAHCRRILKYDGETDDIQTDLYINAPVPRETQDLIEDKYYTFIKEALQIIENSKRD